MSQVESGSRRRLQWRAWRRPLRSPAARWAVVGLVLTGMLAWWLVPSDATPYRKGTISLATGVSKGVYAKYGDLLKPRVERDLPGVHMTLHPSAGSVDNVQRVAQGRDTFTIAAADAVADYSGPGAGRLRACARLYDDYVQLVVPNDSPVSSPQDLKGLRVGVGAQGSGVYLLANRLLHAAGLGRKDSIRPVKAGIDRAPRLLREGKLDAFFWSGGLPTAAVSDLAKELPIRLVPLGPLAKHLREEETDAAIYYRQATMPGDAYPNAYPYGKSVSTIAVSNLLVTTDRVQASLVERLTRSVIHSRDTIGRQVHAAQLVDVRTAVYTDPLPLHEGARRYYRSVKP
ncbi:TAXI family TRAP transporter solute-binding subunit [Wenjunlia tyrosinilytica]|uniref:TAXI family TRAP transporter solute-binding subunit n=1 Tax=Wenjunlia tyrosinilytica TaxID=1544741 RepID=A0A917ZRN0_9ACTN|nr:TAXI family TRAP transporter solute-binding subunit [Wenjunlia tyrosinilytica]GGO91499.1 hypothetical protein GCM10012280_39530 [Wenjunlia tyrosinilytica]